jgi:hypothetical protein
VTGPRIRPFAVALGTTSLMLVLTATIAAAKCDHDQTDAECEAVTATLDGGGALSAGGPQTVGIWVLQEDHAYPAQTVDAVFARVADGTVIRVSASPSDQEARWVATVTLPVGGTWTVTADVNGPDGARARLPLESVQVAAAPAAVASTQSTAAVSPVIPIAIPVAAAMAAVIGAAALLMRGRRLSQRAI